MPESGDAADGVQGAGQVVLLVQPQRLQQKQQGNRWHYACGSQPALLSTVGWVGLERLLAHVPARKTWHCEQVDRPVPLLGSQPSVCHSLCQITTVHDTAALRGSTAIHIASIICCQHTPPCTQAC
jgi:hypothetical protein